MSASIIRIFFILIILTNIAFTKTPCDAIASFLRLNYPSYVIEVMQKQDECELVANGAFLKNRSDFRLRNFFEKNGYKENIDLAADGPDGTEFVYIKQRVSCKSFAHWNFQGLNAPLPTKYELEVICYEK